MIFREPFTGESVVEAGHIAGSGSRDWWVSSGGYFIRGNGGASTVVGKLPDSDRWRLAYARSNPIDTENGFKPQNIFRLVQRIRLLDSRQEVTFRVLATNVANSQNRDASNGVLFFVRYVDQNNLYYAGLRVDGTAVIKRKRNGAYATLAQRRIFQGQYNRVDRPNLLPQGADMTMRVTVTGVSPVRIVLEGIDGGQWRTLAEAEDSSTLRVAAPGYGGIRTDFMDVQFRAYAYGDVADFAEPAPTPPPPAPAPDRVRELEAMVETLKRQLAERDATIALHEARISKMRNAVQQIEALCVGARS